MKTWKHSNDCLTGIILYASFMSDFAISAFFQHLKTVFATIPADAIFVGHSLSRDVLLINSLTEEPSGADRFRTGLTEPSGFSIAIRPLIWHFGKGFCENGPATKPEWIQAAIASEVFSPCVRADGAFVHSTNPSS